MYTQPFTSNAKKLVAKEAEEQRRKETIAAAALAAGMGNSAVATLLHVSSSKVKPMAAAALDRAADALAYRNSRADMLTLMQAGMEAVAVKALAELNRRDFSTLAPSELYGMIKNLVQSQAALYDRERLELDKSTQNFSVRLLDNSVEELQARIAKYIPRSSLARARVEGVDLTCAPTPADDEKKTVDDIIEMLDGCRKDESHGE